MKRRAGLAVALTLGLSAVAQQPIQFSKPMQDNLTPKANVAVPDHGNRSPGGFNAPASLFANDVPVTSFQPLPNSMPSAATIVALSQWQKLEERRRNWALSTPEEILNIPTPERVLGLADADRDALLSPAEQFLKRQDRLAAAGASNALHAADMAVWHPETDAGGSPFQSPDADSRAKLLAGAVPGATPSLGSLFNQDASAKTMAARKADSVWTSPFYSPPQPAQTMAEQLAGMERFRALLPSGTERASAASEMPFARSAAPDSFQKLAVAAHAKSTTPFNPAGRAAAPIRNDIAAPKGLTPLPGVTGPLAPEKKSAPLVQPPPWMQSPLQNSSQPMRLY